MTYYIRQQFRWWRTVFGWGRPVWREPLTIQEIAREVERDQLPEWLSRGPRP